MSSLNQLVVGILASLSGICLASIGGLPGVPKGRTKEEKASWIDWGGSHLNIPEILQSQQAFEAGMPKQAFKSLSKARREIKQGRIKVVETPAFSAQLNNNLAVSAHNLSQRTNVLSKPRLQSVAQRCIIHAAQVPTPSLEIKDTIAHNLKVIVRKR